MKNYLSIIALAAVTLVTSCGTTSTVPISGRKHSLLVSDEQVLSLSKEEYNKYMKTAKPSTNTTNTAMVKRVGQKLATAVENYLRSNGLEAELKNYSWEFNLVQDQGVNAFCMPGGKIVVFEGLLPITRNEASLAIVLGHEIAHAVAKHSAEQMSKKIRQQYGTSIGGSILSAVGAGSVADIAQLAANQYFSFMNLKYSRENETEADHIGLIIAAMAGYDPNEAVTFWQRMAAQSGNSGSDMFSDHPSDAKRIAYIQKVLPDAMKYYNATKSSTSKSSTTRKKSSSKNRR